MRYPHARTNQSFRVCNPTPGTGIAQNIITTFDTTKPLMIVFNTEPAGGRSVYMDYIKLVNSVAGLTTTSAQAAMFLDTVDRRSAGTDLSASIVQPNSLLSATAPAAVVFGACTAIAASAQRQISRDMVKTQAAPCWTIGDEVYVKFDTLDFSPALSSGGGTAIFGVPSGPCVIAPGHSFLFYLWNIANATTAPSWELEMAFWAQQDRG